eukprot:scaffold162696_cov132-Cyclotella_meneghiniana.AAC.1
MNRRSSTAIENESSRATNVYESSRRASSGEPAAHGEDGSGSRDKQITCRQRWRDGEVIRMVDVSTAKAVSLMLEGTGSFRLHERGGQVGGMKGKDAIYLMEAWGE